MCTVLFSSATKFMIVPWKLKTVKVKAFVYSPFIIRNKKNKDDKKDQENIV